MKNIHLKITKENIQEYMRENISLVRHKEPLFVDYMKKSKGITLEGLEILFHKYGEEIPLTKLDYRKNEVLMYLPTFEDDLKNRLFDISAIFYILIPAMRLDGRYNINHSELLHNGSKIAEELFVEKEMIENSGGVLYDVIDSYEVAGQILEEPRYYKGYSQILMSYKKCEYELMNYQCVYGIDNVQKTIKLMKEREW